MKRRKQSVQKRVVAHMRSRFKLPFSLNVSTFDLPVTFVTQGGNTLFKRQITVRTLVLVMVGVLLYFLLVTQTPLAGGGFIGIITWTIGYFWLIYLLAAPTKTKLIGASNLKAMYNYVAKSNREFNTTDDGFYEPIEKMIDIHEISEADSMVIFSNGDVGYIYELIGNASILMFEEDQAHVLGASRNFHRKLTPNVSIYYDSATEPQKTETQVVNLLDKQENLINKHPALMQLMDTQIDVLMNYVGNEFKSLHQYMVVRAKNPIALRDFESWLNLQMDKSSGFLTDFRVLDYEETCQYYKELLSAERVEALKTQEDQVE